jgi:hypothetical protein
LPPSPDLTDPKFLATPKAINILASSFDIQFALDSDADVYWLVIEGKTSTVMQNTLTPAMVIGNFDVTNGNFDVTNGNFSDLTIAAAGIVYYVKAGTNYSISSSAANTMYSNQNEGATGFTVQTRTEYAIILVAQELISQNIQKEFQRYASLTGFKDDSNAKIFDLRTLGLSIKDSSFTLEEEKLQYTSYSIEPQKDTDVDYVLDSQNDCVSIIVTASRTGQLKLSTTSEGSYEEGDLLIPKQCGDFTKVR